MVQSSESQPSFFNMKILFLHVMISSCTFANASSFDLISGFDLTIVKHSILIDAVNKIVNEHFSVRLLTPNLISHSRDSRIDVQINDFVNELLRRNSVDFEVIFRREMMPSIKI